MPLLLQSTIAFNFQQSPGDAALRPRLALFDFRNAARNQERLGLVIKRGRSSGVLCVAVRHEYNQTPPRPR